MCQYVVLKVLHVMQEIQNEELKGHLFELVKSSSSATDRCCLQQVLALLEKYDMRMEEGPSSTVTQDRPIRVIKLNSVLTK